MSLGGQTFRAFRPSRFARPEELEEAEDQVKQAKIRLYTQRAAAGLPLFQQANVVGALNNGPSLQAM